MNLKRTLWTGGMAFLLLLMSSFFSGRLAAQSKLPNRSTPMIDLRPKPKPSYYKTRGDLVDVVDGTTYSSPGPIKGAPRSVFDADGTVILPFAINLPAPIKADTSGFTVEVDLAPGAGDTVNTVFTLVDGSEGPKDILFVVLRDNQGRWYTGKRRDASPGTSAFLWYTQKLWDPISPCVAPRVCTTDTIYVSFQTNGQIQLDEVATFKAGSTSASADRYDWESGLLNFGLPQQGYNLSTFPDTAPVALPQTVPVKGIRLTTLYADRFGSPAILGQSIYPAAHITRVAVWTNNSPSDGIGVIGNANILADQEARHPLLYTSRDWEPCSSGRFEQPKGDVKKLIKQYDPSQLPTPCNVPSAPADLHVHVFTDEKLAAVYFFTPKFLGTALPGQTPEITEYKITSDPPLTSPSCYAGTGEHTCTLKGVVRGTNYTFAVSAHGKGGDDAAGTAPRRGWSPSATVAGGIKERPSAPDLLSAILEPDGGDEVGNFLPDKLTITFKPPVYKGIPVFDHYLVRILGANDQELAAAEIAPDATTYTLHCFYRYHAGPYKVSLAALNKDGLGSASSREANTTLRRATIMPDLFGIYRDPFNHQVNVELLHMADRTAQYKIASTTNDVQALHIDVPVQYRVSSCYQGQPHAIFALQFTESSEAELRVIPQGDSPYYSHPETDIVLPVHFKAETDVEWHLVDWDRDGIPDVGLVYKSGTTSGKVEVHIFSGVSHYQKEIFSGNTIELAASGEKSAFAFYDFGHRGTQDLWEIMPYQTGTNSVEVHILSGETKFTTWRVHTGSGLPALNQPADSFHVGDHIYTAFDWNSSYTDMLYLKKHGQSGKTEVHVFSGITSFKIPSYQQGTEQGETNQNWDWEWPEW